MFDVPGREVSELEWHGDVPVEDRDWNIGLIVGPSGCGKSTILRSLFGAPVDLQWGAPSVIEDFSSALSMDAVASACQAVGFNTIPAWLRPYSVLSNGERFRVDLARRLLEVDGVVAVDEFTSVVDRQVAMIGAHAVQKAIRKSGKRFVAASCHYDILEWLQPDWTLEPASMAFTWRELRRRPEIPLSLRRVDYRAWKLFAPTHYLTAELNPSAQCWCLFAGDDPVAFAGVIHRPHLQRKDIKGLARGVTLPDWQGLGLMMLLISTLGAIYKAAGFELRSYPAHPAWVRSHDRSTIWRLEKRPGVFGDAKRGPNAVQRKDGAKSFGGRPNATFAYCGPAADADEARRAFA
jgi:ABC-type ATPase involved in cell division